MNRPFFSIIIPTYNRAGFVAITLDSVLYQTFADFEVIVVDDGSTDDTSSLIKSFMDPRIRYLHQENKGPGAARNLGIQNAAGSYVTFLDSDDRYRIDKLHKTYEYIREFDEYRIFHTEEIWYRNGEFLAQKIHHKKPSGYIFENAVRLCSISISTCAIERKVFDEVGLFDDSLPACEDYDFWLRVTCRFPVMLIPEYLTIKEGGHADQQSKKYPAMDTYRIKALFNIIRSGVLDENDRALAMDALKAKCAIFAKGALKRGKTTEANYYEGLVKIIETNVR